MGHAASGSEPSGSITTQITSFVVVCLHTISESNAHKFGLFGLIKEKEKHHTHDIQVVLSQNTGPTVNRFP